VALRHRALPATAAQVAAVTVQSFLTMDTWLSTLLTSAPKATLNSSAPRRR
jgi:hypothetical protein